MSTCQTSIAAPVVVTETETLANLTNDAAVIEDDISDLASADLALESYAELIRVAGKNGITRQSAAALQIGLRRIDRKIGTVVASLESIGTMKGGRLSLSMEEAEEQIGVRKEGLADKGKAFVMKLIEKIKELYKKVMAYIKNLGPRITAAKDKAKTWAKGKLPTIQVPPQVVQGLFVDKKPIEMVQLAKFVNYLKAEVAKLKADGTAEPEPFEGPLPWDQKIEIVEGEYQIVNNPEQAEGVEWAPEPQSIVYELTKLEEIHAAYVQAADELSRLTDKLVFTDDGTPRLKRLLSFAKVPELANRISAGYVSLVDKVGQSAGGQVPVAE